MPAIQYRNKAGKKLKGVTTILNVMAKPALTYWGYTQGMENFNRFIEQLSTMKPSYLNTDSVEGEFFPSFVIEELVKGFKPSGLYDKRDKAADAGTFAHAFIENHLKGLPEPSRDGVAKDVLNKAESCYLAYLDWEKAHSFKMVKSELSLISEQHQFGGTIDIGAVVNELGIVDLKTSKDIYFSMWVQVAAYGKLWNENYTDKPIKGYHILRLGENGDFDHKFRPNLNEEWEAFKACLIIQGVLEKTGQKL